jgi:hypothetical protein
MISLDSGGINHDHGASWYQSTTSQTAERSCKATDSTKPEQMAYIHETKNQTSYLQAHLFHQQKGTRRMLSENQTIQVENIIAFVGTALMP